MHCEIGIDEFIKKGQRTVLLEAINTLNEEGKVATFSLATDSDGKGVVRCRASFLQAYEKPAFGMFVDNWHSNLDRLGTEFRRIPDISPDNPSEDTSQEPPFIH